MRFWTAELYEADHPYVVNSGLTVYLCAVSWCCLRCCCVTHSHPMWLLTWMLLVVMLIENHRWNSHSWKVIQQHSATNRSFALCIVLCYTLIKASSSFLVVVAVVCYRRAIVAINVIDVVVFVNFSFTPSHSRLYAIF